MAMLGGVELFSGNEAAAAEESKPAGPKVKVAVIGLGAWGRELLTTLAQVPQADVAGICDTYRAALPRAGKLAPGATPAEDPQALFSNKDIKAVIISTPTHKHKDLVLAALKAGKHVYCEAPLAHTIEDARAIALAAKATPLVIFQAGLQMRCDKQRHFLRPFIRSGALGQAVMARAQWHKKQSWRTVAATPEREQELNWRLNKDVSLGLAGELGIHPIDQAGWFFDAEPIAVRGFGSVSFWKDDRSVPDTVQVLLEFPGGVFMNYNATLANSFDNDYEMLYGSDAAVMMRDGKAWMFKEVDSPLLGWEVYASKQTFYKETGIALVADASKSVPAAGQQTQETVTNTSLSQALTTFLRNAADLSAAVEDATAALGDDPVAIGEQAAKVQRRPSAGYLEGYRATVTAIKTNEAILSRERVELKREWYELA